MFVRTQTKAPACGALANQVSLPEDGRAREFAPDDGGARQVGNWWTSPAGFIRLGVLMFAVGVAAIGATFLAYATGAHDRPVWQNLLCMLAPLGFGLSVWGLVRAGKAEARAAESRIDERSRHTG